MDQPRKTYTRTCPQLSFTRMMNITTVATAQNKRSPRSVMKRCGRITPRTSRYRSNKRPVTSPPAIIWMSVDSWSLTDSTSTTSPRSLAVTLGVLLKPGDYARGGGRTGDGGEMAEGWQADSRRMANGRRRYDKRTVEGWQMDGGEVANGRLRDRRRAAVSVGRARVQDWGSGLRVGHSGLSDHPDEKDKPQNHACYYEPALHLFSQTELLHVEARCVMTNP